MQYTYSFSTKAFLMLFAAAWLTGCGTISQRESTEAVGEGLTVWADDGSDVLVVAQQGWESQRSETERFQHQLFIDSMDGSPRRQLTKMRPNGTGAAYFMKSSGYVILETQLPNDRVKFQKIGLDGREITLIESRLPAQQLCPGAGNNAPIVEHTVLPSPNGELLAHVYSQSCRSLTVDFLRARDLVALDSQTMDIDSPPHITWHPDGDLILAMADGETAWKLMAGLYAEKTAYPNCFSPRTSSSDVTRDGQQVYLRDGKLETRNIGREAAFGCQR